MVEQNNDEAVAVVSGETEPFNWPPLESNPDIFASYMEKCGLPARWTFGEVYGFEEDLLGFIPQPVIAVIVNAEFLKKQEDRQRGDIEVANEYYMKQTGTLDNACGVIACIHAILNNLGEGDNKIALNDGSVLSNYLNSVRSSTPAERATALENYTEFQAVHREFSA